MKKFQTFTGLVAPLDRDNIDTDAIIPKQFLKSIHRTGFGPNLFDEWRYLDYGEPGKDCSNRPLNPDFVLNQDKYKNATILLTGKNFGCGSSREHAPWALADYGFKTIIAESFADIFYNNCFKNGILPITLTKNEIQSLYKKTSQGNEFALLVNLKDATLTDPKGKKTKFKLEGFRKDALLNGLDEIGITLSKSADIKSFEANHQQLQPWLFTSL
ncbi:MAG: 3-isopropylmalate dehydratase small subunit [Candidatus Neomarinimicrobiota bacterium]|nr:3-isopropylmalate dehydratase small subunit [Candidatus Neomarinimicrobiota bacterium]